MAQRTRAGSAGRVRTVCVVMLRTCYAGGQRTVSHARRPLLAASHSRRLGANNAAIRAFLSWCDTHQTGERRAQDSTPHTGHHTASAGRTGSAPHARTGTQGRQHGEPHAGRSTGTGAPPPPLQHAWHGERGCVRCASHHGWQHHETGST